MNDSGPHEEPTDPAADPFAPNHAEPLVLPRALAIFLCPHFRCWIPSLFLSDPALLFLLFWLARDVSPLVLVGRPRRHQRTPLSLSQRSKSWQRCVCAEVESLRVAWAVTNGARRR
uniref:Uncharacterized protein n=1 Tax=Aegilops tauschii subsp. strangulata TaxID=200361 RepID=A0A453HZR0_AEGTS